MAAINFERSLRALLLHEGLNDDDPRDPGGRTSRGITQYEYDPWRKARGLPVRDVWTADEAEVRQIYHDDYWAKMSCDDLPGGVDYAVFDFGVNSGIYRSASYLQFVVGVKEDGVIGPQTIAAAKAMDSASIIIALCDKRMEFLRGLKTWPTFKNGWTTRVNDVKAWALQLCIVPVTPPKPKFPPPPDVEPPVVVPLPRPRPPAPRPEPPPINPTQTGIAAVIAAILGGFFLFWQQVADWLHHLFGG